MEVENLLSDLTGGDDEQAESAAHELIQLGAGAVEPLLQLLTDPRPDTRWWVIRTLAEIPDPRIPPRLAAALDDEDLHVRQGAALALRRQPDPQAVPRLINALASEDRLLARLAGDALAASGPAAHFPLSQVIQSGEWAQPARLEAARALALLSDPAAIPALFEALNDDSIWVQHWANEGLEKLGVGMTFFNP